MKIKNLKFYKRRFFMYGQVLFNIAMIIVVTFLFMQNIHLKKELQCSKANEFKLFNEVNKLEKDVFGLKLNIIAFDKFKVEKIQKLKNNKKINKNKTEQKENGLL